MFKHPRILTASVMAAFLLVLAYAAFTPATPAPEGPLPTVARVQTEPLPSDPSHTLATWRITFPVGGRVADAVAHDETRYMLVQRGRLQVVSDDQPSRIVAPGEVVRINAGAWHQWVNRGTTEGELVAWGVVSPTKLHDACGGALLPEPMKGVE